MTPPGHLRGGEGGGFGKMQGNKKEAQNKSTNGIGLKEKNFKLYHQKNNWFGLLLCE